MVEQVVVNHTRRPQSEFRLTQLQGKYVHRDFLKPQTAIVTFFSSAWLYAMSYKSVEFSGTISAPPCAKMSNGELINSSGFKY